jgi:hypothetical protein
VQEDVVIIQHRVLLHVLQPWRESPKDGANRSGPQALGRLLELRKRGSFE